MRSDSVTVTVIEEPAPKPPRKRSSGGYAYVMPSSVVSLEITNEDIEKVDESTVIVSWDTNLLASTQVVYGTESVSDQDINDRSSTFGYQYSTDELENDLEIHYMSVMNLEPGEVYYFRPVSRSGEHEEIGEELTITVAEQPVFECSYLEDYLRIDLDNNPAEVYKLQVFLNDYQNIETPVSGVFDQATFNSVVIFQERYADEILEPWGHTSGTGYVYVTTKKLINEIVCQKDIDFTNLQSIEIRNYKELMDILDREGFTAPFTSEEIEIIEERFGGNVSAYLESREDEEVTPKRLEDMQIGLTDENDVEDDKGLLAGAVLAVSDFPTGLEESTQSFIMLVLILLLMFLLTVLFAPKYSETPEAESTTLFRRITLFASFTLVALLTALVLSLQGLVVPLAVVLIVSVIVVIILIRGREKPINQELDLSDN